MAAVDPADQAALRSALASQPAVIAEVAELVATKIEAQTAPTEIVMTFCDNLWKPVWECGDYIDMKVSDPCNTTPAGTVTLGAVDEYGNPNPLIPFVQNCRRTLVPVTIEIGNILWAGFVDSTNYKLEKGGNRSCTVNLLGIYDILNYIFILPVYWLPLAVQPLSAAIFWGNICTCIETMIAEQAFRIQFGLHELLNNVLSLNFDTRTWFATWMLNNGNLMDMLTTPIYVVRHNPFKDTSPFVAKTFRMTSLAQAITEMTKAYGIDVSMNLWRPGDPQPDEHASLRVPTYVVRVTDRSGITGPTGTFLDGILHTAVDFAGSMLGKVVAPVIQQVQGMEGVYIAPKFGEEYVPPWTLLIDPGPGKKGAMEEFSIDDHHPKGHTTIIGGKSPAWVNSLINMLLSWLIDSITIVLGVTGVPGTLLEGFLNNALLAFQAAANYDRRVEVGPYGRPESFLATQAAPYNVDAIFSFITAQWDSRGYRSATAVIRNGYPYSYGRDLHKKSLVSIISGGEITTDYLENTLISKTRSEGTKLVLQIGDGKAEEAPIVKHQQNLTGILEILNVVTLAPTG